MSKQFTSSVLNQASAERQTAEALYASERLAESRAHIEQALILLGRPMPKGRGRLVAGLLIQILRQVRNRIGLDRFSGHPPETQAILLETARAYALLGEICARAGETWMLTFITVRRVNLCEHAAPSPELIRAYRDMSALSSRFGLRTLAEVYARRAQATARRVAETQSPAR